MWSGVVWSVKGYGVKGYGVEGYVWSGMVWNVEWCGVVWSGVERHGVEWCGVEWCGVVWCGVEWHGVEWCGEVENWLLGFSCCCPPKPSSQAESSIPSGIPILLWLLAPIFLYHWCKCLALTSDILSFLLH